MGTLSSELQGHVGELAARPRIYVDANMPARVVAHMREALGWDVLFVLEDEGLRRAPDRRHYQLARQLHRTLVTLDRDYLDDRRFPPDEGAGVVVLSAPDERAFVDLLHRLDRFYFQSGTSALPLVGRKMQIQTDWTGEP